jgi:hypothetical protein
MSKLLRRIRKDYITWTFCKQIPTAFTVISNIVNEQIVFFKSPWPSPKLTVIFTRTAYALTWSRHGDSYN